MCEAASSDHASEMKIVRRGRGNVLLFEGFQYYFHTKYENGNCIWRCKNFKKSEKCTGIVTVMKVCLFNFIWNRFAFDHDLT